LTVGQIASRDLVIAYPEETVDAVLRRMAPRDLSRLPVVDRENPRLLAGVIRRNDIVRAHEIGAMRREEARRRAESQSAVSGQQAEFVDVVLVPDSKAIAKTIAELQLPREAVLVSIRRGQELVIPHGDTRLEAGDVVTALCDRGCEEEVKEALNRGKEQGIGDEGSGRETGPIQEEPGNKG
jgi:CBS domain-containing protein